VFWDLVEGMVRRGQSLDVAIDNIYRVYGWNNSVTKILNEMTQKEGGNAGVSGRWIFLGDEHCFHHGVGGCFFWGDYY